MSDLKLFRTTAGTVSELSDGALALERSLQLPELEDQLARLIVGGG